MPRQRHSSSQALSVFRALLENTQNWRHGYDLLRETGLKSGTLYPLLMRLEREALLESEWQPPVPPARAPRHAYRLTRHGTAFAHALIAQKDATAQMAECGKAV
ncbi:MAG: helix-turn-helix transcriptional regulator [Sphingorhabdus sp.]